MENMEEVRAAEVLALRGYKLKVQQAITVLETPLKELDRYLKLTALETKALQKLLEAKND